MALDWIEAGVRDGDPSALKAVKDILIYFTKKKHRLKNGLEMLKI